MKLVLASQNKKKLVEMDQILSQLGIEVCLQSQVGAHVEVEETGTTFEENSLLKAKAVMEATGMPAIWMPWKGLPVSTLPGTAGRGWMMWVDISCCWKISRVNLPGAPSLSL